MNEIFDVYNIILLGLAVFILLRLRSVLGKRTGHERPPFDPYSGSDKQSGPDEKDAGDNVVHLPGHDRVETSVETEKVSDDAILEKFAPAGSALNEALRSVLSADRSFEPEPFLQGARSAYEMIVTAFANGDRKALKPLLSSEVYNGFADAIDEREKREETIESTFVGIDKAEIVEAALKGTHAQVTVKIRSQLISATKDKSGAVIDGDPAKVAEVVDIWTFERDTASRDPNWKLVGTESV